MNMYCVEYEIDGKEVVIDTIASSKMECYDLIPVGAVNIRITEI